jgi:hypothetical protein
MADNTDEEYLDNPKENQSGNSPDEIIPNNNTETINPNQETENMEVHHHAHNPAEPHHKKNWKSYFWEFLMLFLAVFCGFLAEYQLEHKIERDRAKELAKSFYEELKNDSLNAAEKFQNRNKQELAARFLVSYFKDISTTSFSKEFVINFHYGVMFRSPYLFEARTVVLEQLKNSGSLRYFKSQELQKLIGDLSVTIYNINDRQELETNLRAEYINPFIAQHYNYDFDKAIGQFGEKTIFENMLAYEKSTSVIPFQFVNRETLNTKLFANYLSFYTSSGMRGTKTLHLQKYIEINSALLKELRKEYNLK